MDDILEPHELAEAIGEGLSQAARIDMPFLRVSIMVPYRSHYAWRDDFGATRSVHLPTRAHMHPTEYPVTQMDDGGPAAVFMLGPTLDYLPMAAAVHLADDLYARAIAWGQMQYGGGEPAGGAHPEVPMTLDGLVAQAMETDVLH